MLSAALRALALRTIAMSLCLLAGLPAQAQSLNWSSPFTEGDAYNVGGAGGRPGVSTVIYNGATYTTYLSSANCSANCPVLIATNAASGGGYVGGGGVNGNALQAPYQPSLYSAGNGMVANSNPTLYSFNGILYIANEDSYGTALVAYSTDGHVFQSFTGNNWISGPAFSPSMAVDPNNPGTLYVAYANGSGNTPVLCTATISGSSKALQGCQYLTNLRSMNYYPSIAFFNGVLYMGFEDRGDSHCLYFYKYTPSNNSFAFWNPINCAEQTSTAPSLAVHNGALYVAFGTNDSSRKFTVRVSTTGNDLAFRQQPGFSMNGAPDLLDLNQPPFNINGLMESHAVNGVLNVSLGQ